MNIARPLVSVIVPVRNGAPTLVKSLEALAASDLARDCWELIVVDDASDDGSVAVAGRFADTVIKLSGRARGPAYARNRGFEIARGEILVFVDADVCVHSDTLRRLARHFAVDPTVGAIIGSYDDAAHGDGLVTHYRNLRHCHIRQRGAGEVDTFWSAMGAVRRSAFLDAGLFDEWHYWRPQVEGIELGHRLRARGHRILLDPTIQGTHLKRWTLFSVVTTDLLDLGVPWMRLLFQEKSVGSTRSPHLSATEKLNTALTWSALLCSLAWLVFPHPLPATGALACAFAVLVGTMPLLLFFARARGPLFAIAAFPLQVLHYLIVGASVVCAWLLHQLVGEPRRDATDDAFAEVGLQTWPPIPRRRPADAWQTPTKQ